MGGLRALSLAICDHFIYKAYILWATFFLIMISDMDWEWKWPEARFYGPSQYELRLKLPDKPAGRDFRDEGWDVEQAVYPKFALDVHETMVFEEAPEDYIQDKPHERVIKTLERYQIKNIQFQGQESLTTNDVPLKKYRFTGTKDGDPFAMEVVAITKENKVWLFTFFYRANSKDGKGQVEDCIDSFYYKHHM